MNRAAASSIAILAMLAVTFGTAVADPPESSMLPLQPGNYWYYVSPFMGNAVVRSAEWIDIYGYRVSRMEGYMFPIDGSDVYLLNNACQWVCEMNPKNLEPNIPPWTKDSPIDEFIGTWYCCSHSIYEGQKVSVPLMADDCVHGTRGFIANKGHPITVPAGEFPWSVTIVYDQNPCSDSGICSEILVPDVGVVRRTVRTPGGRYHTFELQFAVVSGHLIGSPSSKLADKPSDLYTAPELESTTWGAIKSRF
jgi:hypothetical protein